MRLQRPKACLRSKAQGQDKGVERVAFPRGAVPSHWKVVPLSSDRGRGCRKRSLTTAVVAPSTTGRHTGRTSFHSSINSVQRSFLRNVKISHVLLHAFSQNTAMMREKKTIISTTKT